MRNLGNATYRCWFGDFIEYKRLDQIVTVSVAGVSVYKRIGSARELFGIRIT